MTSRAFEPQPIVYPERDGRPMADNTLQFEWIVTLKENLDAALAGFVAGDLLWYPLEGQPEERIAPDVLVAPGRPKGHRGSYQQWLEGGEPPAVVMEVLSPGNTVSEMLRKLGFYDRHGVEELYVVDPELEVVEVFTRVGGALREVPWVGRFASPRLGFAFSRADERLLLHHADGRPFVTFQALRAREAALTAERDQLAAQRDALLARLRAAGLEP